MVTRALSQTNNFQILRHVAWVNTTQSGMAFRIGEFEEAEIRLGNAFKIPLTKAIHMERLEESDAVLACDFVQQLEETQALDLDRLQRIVREREDMITEDSGTSLDATGFLQVRQFV